jgi:hypothetical protein
LRRGERKAGMKKGGTGSACRRVHAHLASSDVSFVRAVIAAATAGAPSDPISLELPTALPKMARRFVRWAYLCIS